MKLFYFCFWAFLFTCCSFHKSDAVKEFVPGLYVGSIDEQISNNSRLISLDTFEIISSAGKGSEVYEITRTRRILKTIDGVTLPEEYKTEHWTAVYNDAEKNLMVKKSGRIFFFFPEENLMKMGNTEYKKIK